MNATKRFSPRASQLVTVLCLCTGLLSMPACMRGNRGSQKITVGKKKGDLDANKSSILSGSTGTNGGSGTGSGTDGGYDPNAGSGSGVGTGSASETGSGTGILSGSGSGTGTLSGSGSGTGTASGVGNGTGSLNNNNSGTGSNNNNWNNEGTGSGNSNWESSDSIPETNTNTSSSSTSNINLNGWNGLQDEAASSRLWVMKTIRDTEDSSSSNNNSNNTNNNNSTNNNGNNTNNNNNAGGGSGGSAGRVEGNKVIFEIPAGNSRRSSWNEAANPVRAKVGQTLVIVNKDSVSHYLHTNGRPFQHPASSIAPGQSAEYPLEQAFTDDIVSQTGGDLYEHDENGGGAYINIKFYLRVTP